MKSATSDDPVCITGMGMVTSLGCDVATSCAAARAGIVQSQQLEYFRYRSASFPDGQAVVGHPVPLLTMGFEGNGRLLRLFQGAMTDLQRQVTAGRWSKTSVGAYLSLPDPNREYTGLDLIMDEEARQSLAQEAQQIDMKVRSDAEVALLLQKAALLSGWGRVLPLQYVAQSGHTGIAEALQKAINDLQSNRIETAIVGGVDTLLEEGTLAWLLKTGRLKTEFVASGLQPGEAGVFLLIQTVATAKDCGACLLGILDGLSVKDERRTLLSGGCPLGIALAEVVYSLSSSLQLDDLLRVWFITDQNGEPYRAMEWGNTIVRLAAHSKKFEEPILWYPATSFGDTGAASGALSICMAIRAFGRKYAPEPIAVIVSSGDRSSRTAVVLKRPPRDS